MKEQAEKLGRQTHQVCAVVDLQKVGVLDAVYS